LLQNPLTVSGREKRTVRLPVCFLFLAFLFPGCGQSPPDFLPSFLVGLETIVERISPEDLAGWQLVGKGNVKVDDTQNAVILTEGSDSKGITLVSQKTYGRRVIMSFDVKPLSYEGVVFAIMSASDKVTMGKLKVPEDHTGTMNYWTEGRVQNYIFAFHNGFFETKPYIKRNPGLKDVAIAQDVVEGKSTFSVEIGRRGRRMWIKIDGDTVVSGKDRARGGLPGGRLGFRLRGPGAGSFACILKNVVITEEK